jgi:hypothetical protein
MHFLYISTRNAFHVHVNGQCISCTLYWAGAAAAPEIHPAATSAAENCRLCIGCNGPVQPKYSRCNIGCTENLGEGFKIGCTSPV